MTDLLIAVADGETRFDAEYIVNVALRRWPTAGWGEPDDELASTMAKQVMVRHEQQILIVDILASLQGIGVEGDDDLAAEFVALLTQSMLIPEGDIVVMNWADDVVTLRPNMSAPEVHALRDA